MEGMSARVLVVDDDPALAEMLGIVLRGEGFDPVFCADGGEALQAFRDSRPDIILLDLMLPGMDGIDVCRAIRQESGVPIVMLSKAPSASEKLAACTSPMPSFCHTTSASPANPRASPSHWARATLPPWPDTQMAVSTGCKPISSATSPAPMPSFTAAHTPPR